MAFLWFFVFKVFWWLFLFTKFMDSVSCSLLLSSLCRLLQPHSWQPFILSSNIMGSPCILANSRRTQYLLVMLQWQSALQSCLYSYFCLDHRSIFTLLILQMVTFHLRFSFLGDWALSPRFPVQESVVEIIVYCS